MPLGICLLLTIINFLRYMNPVMTDRPAVFSNSASTTFRLAFMYSTNGSFSLCLHSFIAFISLSRAQRYEKIHFTSLSSQGYFFSDFEEPALSAHAPPARKSH